MPPSSAATDTTKKSDTSRVSIDASKGHIGISCENDVGLSGVLLTFCDPADLAHKAGLREGDVVVRINGVMVKDHSALVDAINTASAATAGSSAATIQIEYHKKAAAAALVAALEKERPPQKSTLVAYLLWLIAPAFGLHHLYLGRDAHCVLHVLSLGGIFGAGWWRDLLCMGRYVEQANEEPKRMAELKMQMELTPTPRNGWISSRRLAMLVFGLVAAYAASCVLPAAEEAPWPAEAAFVLHGLLQALGAAVGVYAVGSLPPHRSSFARTLRSAAIAAAGSHALGIPHPFWTAAGAIRGFGGAMEWRPLRPQRRMTVGLRKRALVVVCGIGVGWSTAIVGLYQHGGVGAMVNGQPQFIRFKDAVHHVLRSPAVRHIGAHLYTLLMAPGGWRTAWEAFYADLDLAGEDHACGVLGLEPKCVADFSAVKRAHRQLVLENHPDKLIGASDDEKASASERFRAVQEAYEHLQQLNAANKKRENGEEAGGGTEDEPEQGSAAARARMRREARRA